MRLASLSTGVLVHRFLRRGVSLPHPCSGPATLTSHLVDVLAPTDNGVHWRTGRLHPGPALEAAGLVDHAGSMVTSRSSTVACRRIVGAFEDRRPFVKTPRQFDLS